MARQRALTGDRLAGGLKRGRHLGRPTLRVEHRASDGSLRVAELLPTERKEAAR